MTIIFLISLFTCYLYGILGTKAQNFALRYPNSVYSFSAIGYGKKFIFFCLVTIGVSFFTSYFSWLMEVILIVSIAPISGILGYYLAKNEHQFRNGVDMDKAPASSKKKEKNKPELEKVFQKVADYYENIPVPKLKDKSHSDTYKLMSSAVELGYKDIKSFVSTFENDYRAESVVRDLKAFQAGEIDSDTLFENHTFLKLSTHIDKNKQWSDYLQDLLVCEISVRVLIDGIIPGQEYEKLYLRIDELVEMEFFDENKMIDIAKRITEDPAEYLKSQRFFRKLNA